jgi:hypothetical protein
MAEIQNFTIDQGSTWVQPILWQTGAPPAAVDITGYTARMQVRLMPGAPVVASLTTENGGIALGGVAGTITLTMTASVSAAIPASGCTKYRYDLELISPGGAVRRFIEGTITIRPEITA